MGVGSKDPVNLNVRVTLLKLVIESCHDVNLLECPCSKSANMEERSGQLSCMATHGEYIDQPQPMGDLGVTQVRGGVRTRQVKSEVQGDPGWAVLSLRPIYCLGFDLSQTPTLLFVFFEGAIMIGFGL